MVRALGDLQNFKLHLGRLNNGHKIFLFLLLVSIFVRRLVDLLLALEIDLPDVVGDLEGLILNLQILRQFGEDLLGRDRREEAVCLVGAFLVLLEREQDSARVISFLFSQFRVFVPSVVELAFGITAARLGLDVSLHGLLAVLLLLCHGLVLLVSRYELLAHFLGIGKLTALQPWVCNYVGDGEPLVGVEVQHGGDQVLELLVEEAFCLAVRVSGPELLASVRGNQLVVWILQVCHVEGRVSRVQNEQYDAESEQIYNLTLVGLFGVDLRRHESERADNAAVHSIAGSALDWAREAEVDDLDVVELVEQDILAFEVTMGEALGVDIVDRLDQLLGVVAHDALLERPRVRHVVEELATVDQLADDVGDGDLFSILLGPDGVLVELEVFDDVLVVERLHRLHLVAQ